mmetsp:Transcript_59621/g.144024  ORF Transcript_59621/g.144024 Transcript_59621/m.144024 type:complete len:247 (+) Transcript_59621:1500-2240(+)
MRRSSSGSLASLASWPSESCSPPSCRALNSEISRSFFWCFRISFCRDFCSGEGSLATGAAAGSSAAGAGAGSWAGGALAFFFLPFFGAASAGSSAASSTSAATSATSTSCFGSGKAVSSASSAAASTGACSCAAGSAAGAGATSREAGWRRLSGAAPPATRLAPKTGKCFTWRARSSSSVQSLPLLGVSRMYTRLMRNPMKETSSTYTCGQVAKPSSSMKSIMVKASRRCRPQKPGPRAPLHPLEP